VCGCRKKTQGQFSYLHWIETQESHIPRNQWLWWHCPVVINYVEIIEANSTVLYIYPRLVSS
jgi:hypothetical protein